MVDDCQINTKDRVRKRSSLKKENGKAPTKLIIRHLPPTMTEEEFLNQVEPLPEHDFYYFVAADWSLGFEATCRAYINVKKFDDVYTFRDQFDGYVFVDSKGAEYSAIVEFAPFQGMVKNKSRRNDNKVGTIEEESHFQQYLVKMEEDREAAIKSGEHKLEFTLDRKEEKITSTPLLQYLANKKEKRREDAKKRVEEKRRREGDKRRQRETVILLSSKMPAKSRAHGQDDSNAGKEDGHLTISRRDNNAGENADLTPDDRKNSRSKRRAERDARRRDEHEQRKRERERMDYEKREVAGNVELAVGKANTSNRKVFFETKNVDGKAKIELDGAKPKRDKDGKKFNERRNRNRRGGAENVTIKSQSFKPSAKESFQVGAKMEQKEESLKGGSNDAAVKEHEVSDTVRSFIRSVVNTKEFVPKGIQGDLPTDIKNNEPKVRAATSKTTAADATKVAKTAKVEQKKSDYDEPTTSTVESRKLERQRSAEERRIRNKNRPSIAIYQPKPRTQRSEESDSNVTSQTNENEKTNATNADEKQPLKKNSRYSERRAERRANAYRERQKAAEVSSNGDVTLRNTKSTACGEDGKEMSTERSSSEIN